MLQEVRAYTQYLESRNYAPRTIAGIRNTLLAFMDYTYRHHHVEHVTAITEAIIRAWQTFLMNQYPPLGTTTLCGRYLTLRRFYGYLQRQGILLYNPALVIVVPKRTSALPYDILTEPEVRQLIAAIDTVTPVGMRNRAIVETFYACGLRRSELMQLDIYDLNLRDCTIHIREGKGGRDRVVPLTPSAVHALEAYLEHGRPCLACPQRSGQALFLTCRGDRISHYVMNDLFQQLTKKSNLGKRIRPHGLRHAVATHLVRSGVDIRYVQTLLGHKRLGTTQIYVRAQLSDIRDAYIKAHPRDRMKGLEKPDSL